MKRGPLMLGVMFAALYGPAFAADTTISSNTSTALKTSTSGNITINGNVSVTVATTGAVVTIDSGTSLSPSSVSNSGLIQNIGTGGGAIGVEILPGFTGSYIGSFVNDGITHGINVPYSGANNIGLLLAGTGTNGMVPGNGTFTGDITLGVGSSVIVTGPEARGNLTGPTAIGVDILSNLNGNLTIGSILDVKGEGVAGVITAADINGVLDISGGANLFGRFTSYTL